MKYLRTHGQPLDLLATDREKVRRQPVRVGSRIGDRYQASCLWLASTSIIGPLLRFLFWGIGSA
jgi:hypothetical protein